MRFYKVVTHILSYPMKRNNIFSIAICLVAFAFILPFKAQSQHLSWQWVNIVHGSAAILPFDITGDNNDNVIVCGQTESGRTYFENDTLYSNGGMDMFLAKYDASGDLIWRKNPGGTGMEFANSVCTDSSNNIYVTGGFRSGGMKFDTDSIPFIDGFDMFFAKYDPDGKQLWVRHIGGKKTEIGNVVRYDPNGYIICAWNCYEGQTIYYGIDSIYQSGPQVITKFTTDGNMVWSKSCQGNISHLDVNTDGEILAGGSIQNYAVINGDTLTKGIFIEKIDPVGNLMWARHGEGIQFNGLTADSTKNIYSTGFYQKKAVIFGKTVQQFEDQQYCYIAKLDSAGNAIWVHNLESEGNATAFNITTNNANKIIINGRTLGLPVDFGNDLKFNNGSNMIDGFNALFDSSGTALWVEPSTRETMAMRYQLPNTLLMAGRINQSDKLGNIEITAPFNSQGIYIAKAKEGNTSAVRISSSNDNRTFSAYYHPTSDELTLYSNTPIQYPCTIKVYDVVGKMVKSSAFISGGAQKLTIEANDLSNGAYSLEITSEHQSASSKVMIVK